jgi:hypothetical protein
MGAQTVVCWLAAFAKMVQDKGRSFLGKIITDSPQVLRHKPRSWVATVDANYIISA